MLKTVLSLVSMFGCICAGYIFSGAIKERLKVLNEIASCLERMKIRLSYDAPSCEELLKKPAAQLKTKWPAICF